MKNNSNKGESNSSSSHNNSKNNRFIPNSLKFISSCIKTASSGVRSASASVAASISGDHHDRKDQVLWASFDKLELGPGSLRNVLLLGYSSGFQVIDVEDASNITELVSRRDDPVTFLQMQPLPAKSEGCKGEGYRASHPLLLVVACDESKSSGPILSGRDGFNEPHMGNVAISPTIVRFYSLRSHNYVHVLRFRSTVYMVRSSRWIVAVGLATQIYCFDALTFENKFSVLTYPVPQLGGQGMVGVNIGYGPMAVGPRWLAYASDNPLVLNTGRLSPQSLTPLGVSPSSSPGSGSLVARYAMESSKQLATGLINLGDMGYKTLSRYCQDLMPDGSSSPVSSNSSWKVGRGATNSADTDTAGMVVVKDFVSRAVISQFRAHTSPISALCFDPSGTLLVTASIHGNNINIFRIMPSCSQSGQGAKNYDWSSSHVHLYKLHRGITPAIIQDICFSHYSQWIAIVSSRGTCHIFVLSPFGGENVLQIHNSHVDGPALSPVVSLPWWSTPAFLVNQHSFSSSPPSPVTLSVVSRIKNNNSGWLNTVSNATSSAAGKASIPSGAIAAVFHSCVPQDSQSAHLRKDNSLEHLMVYTPCGHVVQYKLLSSVGGEPSEIASRNGPASSVHMQDEELRVNVESIQWWDVCRRADWPEREECISGITRRGQETKETVMDTSDGEDDGIAHSQLVMSHEPSHWYLSNAEVQMSFWRIQLWQKSKMYFYAMSHPGPKEENISEDQTGQEIEIEKVPVHEVEIRRKDLLPVFDHFHRSPEWSERGLGDVRYSSSSSESRGVKESEDAVVSHSELASPDSAPSSDGGSSTKFYPSMLQAANSNAGEGGISMLASPILYESSINKDICSVSLKQAQIDASPVENSNFVNNNVTSLTKDPHTAGRMIAKEVQSSESGVTSEASNLSSIRSDLSMNITDEGPANDSLDSELYFQEGYCKVSELNECQESTEVLTFVDNSSSPCDVDKSEEDGDNDDMLGGVFSFSEEG
ncbi:autophagy-related protein 18h-like isoform X1 [Populus alba x Populus x berolinensis]|uniref:Autophagy-related protein 18h-like n=1 Tax=Populus alba TaxID=43335 RepID=A0A4U5QJQ2_POPAL|nr:autophagy-related protein 18h-like isoform X1 [Populus alba]KAJ6928850.1 autophagy-related protein 18h-like isoform X1 [Populus alba x Populus x berolinensis]TKS10883.1 autophagy-related protein 18h-like [Populus alba]